MHDLQPQHRARPDKNLLEDQEPMSPAFRAQKSEDGIVGKQPIHIGLGQWQLSHRWPTEGRKGQSWEGRVMGEGTQGPPSTGWPSSLQAGAALRSPLLGDSGLKHVQATVPSSHLVVQGSLGRPDIWGPLAKSPHPQASVPHPGCWTGRTWFPKDSLVCQHS